MTTANTFHAENLAAMLEPLPSEIRQRAADIEARQVRLWARVEEIARRLDGVTVGYIGNVYSDGTDDRGWSVFLEHPGRVGESFDRIGSFATSERGRLLPIIEAIEAGFAIARHGIAKASADRAERNRARR